MRNFLFWVFSYSLSRILSKETSADLRQNVTTVSALALEDASVRALFLGLLADCSSSMLLSDEADSVSGSESESVSESDEESDSDSSESSSLSLGDE